MPKTLADLQERDMLTRHDVADYLGVCPETARRIMHQANFPPISTFGRTHRVHRDAFVRWVAREFGAGSADGPTQAAALSRGMQHEPHRTGLD